MAQEKMVSKSLQQSSRLEDAVILKTWLSIATIKFHFKTGPWSGDQVGFKKESELLQQELESMVPKEENVQLHTQIDNFQSEFSWASSLITELLPKMRIEEITSIAAGKVQHTTFSP